MHVHPRRPSPAEFRRHKLDVARRALRSARRERLKGHRAAAARHLDGAGCLRLTIPSRRRLRR